MSVPELFLLILLLFRLFGFLCLPIFLFLLFSFRIRFFIFLILLRLIIGCARNGIVSTTRALAQVIVRFRVRTGSRWIWIWLAWRSTRFRQRFRLSLIGISSAYNESRAVIRMIMLILKSANRSWDKALDFARVLNSLQNQLAKSIILRSSYMPVLTMSDSG